MSIGKGPREGERSRVRERGVSSQREGDKSSDIVGAAESLVSWQTNNFLVAAIRHAA